MNNPLESLLYITISPKQAKKEFAGLDASIPLPVRLPELSFAGEFNPEDISAEVILAGMLTVFAFDRENINIQYYRKIFNRLRPDVRTPLINAAVLKIKNGDFDSAEELLLALEGLNPDDSAARLNLALLMEERCAFFETADLYEKSRVYEQRAERLYESLIISDPPLPEAFFNAAYFFIKQKKYKRALSLLQTYLQIESAVTEAADIRKAKAKTVIKSIAEQSLDDDLFAEAYSLINSGREERAAEKVKAFLRKKPKVWNGWFLLGWSLRLCSRWEDSKAAFLKALELLECTENPETPSFCSILNELAICNIELGLFDEAEKRLIKALEYEPENIKTISNLGTLALKCGKTAEAEAFFAAVLEINPNDKIALSVLNLKSTTSGAESQDMFFS